MLCSIKCLYAFGITAVLIAVPAVISAGEPATAKPPVTQSVAKPVVDKAPMDIIDTAAKAGTFKTLTAAVKAAGLVDTLKGKGPFTLLAPTDEAFAKLPAGTLASLLKPENKDKLKAILTYHVLPEHFTAADIAKLKSTKTVNGATLRIMTEKNMVMVDDANVTKTDIHCANGVIHVIDAVLMPKK